MLTINNSHLDWDGGIHEVAEHDDVLRHQKVLKCNEAKTVLLAELVYGLFGVEGVTADVGEKVNNVLHEGHSRISWQRHIESSVRINTSSFVTLLRVTPLRKTIEEGNCLSLLTTGYGTLIILG